MRLLFVDSNSLITNRQTLPWEGYNTEYVDAFRAEGLKVDLYSLIDWHPS